jgi:hypothetical protein
VPARAGRPDAITAIEIPVDDLQRQLREERQERVIDETPALLVPPRLTAQRADWWRPAAAVCGLIAVVTTSLLAFGWRRAPVTEARARQAAIAAMAPPAPVAAASGPSTGSGLAFELLPVAPQAQPAPPPAVARADEREHRRRHRRRHAVEDNTTLPPSNADMGGIDFRP